MRRYLAEFLADPRVVELPRWLWLPVLNLVVLRKRPEKSAEKYKLIWTPEGSPLAVHTKRQAALLSAHYAMRYGEPSIGSVIAKLKDPLVVPLYPQYSKSTTETIIDLLPKGTSVVRDFHDHPAYISALCSSIKDSWQERGRAEKLVMSFHGLPQRAVDRGDPYQKQCLRTVELLAKQLQVSDYVVTFQSRFGAAKWLQPYTEPTLVELARKGVKRLDVVCPGFVSDCLETLEEIDITARAAFLAAGGTEFRYIPCLNERPDWIEALRKITTDSSS